MGVLVEGRGVVFWQRGWVECGWGVIGCSCGCKVFLDIPEVPLVILPVMIVDYVQYWLLRSVFAVSSGCPG